MPAPNRQITDILSRLSALERQEAEDTVAVRNQIEALQRNRSDSTDFFRSEAEKIRTEIQSIKAIGKTVAFILTIGVPIAAGIIGWGVVQVFNKVDGTLTRFEQGLVEKTDYFSTVQLGRTYWNARQYDQAANVLKICQSQQPYDEAVLPPLLNSIDTLQKWVEAAAIIDALKKNPARFNEMNQAATHLNIGVILLAVGRTDEAASSFADASKLTAGTDYKSHYYIDVYQWLCHRVRRQRELAVSDIARIRTLPAAVQIDAWDDVRVWPTFALTFEREPDLAVAMASEWRKLQQGMRQLNRNEQSKPTLQDAKVTH